MRFIRDIIKENRACSREEHGKLRDETGPTAEPMSTRPEALLLETPINGQALEEKAPGELSPSLKNMASAESVGARRNSDRAGPGSAAAPAPASERVDEGFAEEAGADAILNALHAIEKDGEIEDPDAEDAFEPFSTGDSEKRSDPFDRLRTPQYLREESATAAPRVSALGKMKPTPSTLAEMSPEPSKFRPASSVDEIAPRADAMEQDTIEMPSPAAGRGSSRSGRVKTRLLGFSAGAIEQDDPFEKSARLDDKFPVGWLVVISEMGRGASFALHDGVSKVGRGTDQTVCLDFGDNSISRDNHISIAFDAEQNRFFVGHSGKANLVRINNVPLLSTEELHSKDLIRIGETTLRFIAFCEDDFGWEAPEEQVSRHA